MSTLIRTVPTVLISVGIGLFFGRRLTYKLARYFCVFYLYDKGLPIYLSMEP